MLSVPVLGQGVGPRGGISGWVLAVLCCDCAELQPGRAAAACPGCGRCRGGLSWVGWVTAVLLPLGGLHEGFGGPFHTQPVPSCP